MIDHLGIRTKDVAAAKAFYAAALKPLGYVVMMELPDPVSGVVVAVGLGAGGKPDFWLSPGAPQGGLHIAFATEDRATVDAFHAAALAAGAKDNGAPGLRPEYHRTYYGAFVLDADGNNVEAVCHRPE